LARSFERHLRAQNKSPRTVEASGGRRPVRRLPARPQARQRRPRAGAGPRHL